MIRAAINHDFSKYAQDSEMDRRAVEALGAGLEGSTRALLVTAGVALLARGRGATKDDAPPPLLGRQPEQPGLIADIEHPGDFES